MATQEYQSSSGAIIFKHSPEEIAMKDMKKEFNEMKEKYEEMQKMLEELSSKLDESK